MNRKKETRELRFHAKFAFHSHYRFFTEDINNRIFLCEMPLELMVCRNFTLAKSSIMDDKIKCKKVDYFHENYLFYINSVLIVQLNIVIE